MLLGALGILLGIFCVSFMAYKGYSPAIGAPIAAIIICITSGLAVNEGLMTSFSTGFGNMMKAMFFIYITGTLLAAVMTKSRAAYSIARWMANTFGTKHAAVVVLMTAAILAVGGMGMGSYFFLYPIALMLFSKSNISKDLILGCMIAGNWCLGVLPFIPSQFNAIAMGVLGTSRSAGMIPGLVGGIALIVMNCVYVDWQGKKWAKNGRGFEAWDELPKAEENEEENYPPFWRAILPLIAVLVLYNGFDLNVAASLFLGAVLEVVLEFKAFSPKEWLAVCEGGVMDGIVPLTVLGCMGGLGAVVSTTPFYASILQTITTSSVNPYLLALISSDVVAGCLGSSSSAMATVLPTLKPAFENWVATQGLNMGVFHRLCLFGSLGLDSLPHNGAVSACSRQFNSPLKKSYFPVFITSVLNVIICGFITLAVAMMGFV